MDIDSCVVIGFDVLSGKTVWEFAGCRRMTWHMEGGEEIAKIDLSCLYACVKIN